MDQSPKEPFLEETNEIKKCCSDCKTTNTPLWRGGPTGPKSLCNACGIRYRKRRSGVVGVNKSKEKVSSNSMNNDNKTSTVSSGKDGKLKEGLRVRLMGLGKEVVKLQKRQRSPLKRRTCRIRKLGEAEQAAVLLMALSCTSVLAWK